MTRNDFDPGVEGDGRYLVATIQSAGKVSPVFERKLREMASDRFAEVDDERWYPIGEFVEFFEELESEVGSQTLEEAGVENGKAIPWPPEVDSLDDALGVINDLHREATRGSNREWPIGRYVVEERGSSGFRVGVTEEFPHPNPYTKGVLKGIANNFGGERHTVSEASPRDDERAAWTLE